MATASNTLTGASTRLRTSASENNLNRFWLAVAVLGAPTAYLITRCLRDPTVLERAYAAAWLVLLLFLDLLLLLTRHRGGLLSTVTGADNRYSTSKLQTALWTLAIGFGLSLLVALAVFDRKTGVNQLFGSELKEEYLVLLGGPFAARLAAGGIVGHKVREGQLQKYDADAPSPLDVAADDNGNLDLADMQYLFFNLIALAYFLAKLLPNPAQGLPDMPATLLGLTSAATVGYLGNKALDSNGPVVTSVIPSTVHLAEEIVIRGKNLIPAGGAGGGQPDPTVLFNGLTSPAVTVSPDGTVKATVPPGVHPGSSVDVKVVTPAGIETEPRIIKMAEVVPQAPDGLPVALPVPDAPALINRAGYPPARDDAGDTDGDDDDHDMRGQR